MTTSPGRRRLFAAALLATSVLLGAASGQESSSSPALKEHVVLKDGLDAVWSLSFSRDNRTLAAGLKDSTVRVWDVVSGKELAILRGHTGGVRSVAFSPDGKTIASGSRDGTVKLWSWDGQGKLLATLDAHKGRVLSVAFAPGGKLLASGSFDGTVKLWDVAERKVKFNLEQGEVFGIRPAVPRRASTVAFSPNGKMLGAVTSDVAKLWDATTGRPLATLSIPGIGGGSPGDDSFGGDKEQEDAWSSAAFTSNGKFFATSWSGSRFDRAPVKLWDTATHRPRDLLQSRLVKFVLMPGTPFAASDTRLADHVRTFAFSARLVATCGWQVPYTGKEKTGEDIARVEMEWHKNIEYTVKLWDSVKGTAITRMKGHTAMCRAATFSPDGSLLATGSEDRTIRVWVIAKALEKKGTGK
jgi:YD repeat-containing protein